MSINKLGKRDILYNLMSRYPNPPYSISHPLWRAVEALILLEIAWAPPKLDLGCGDGAFSSTIFNNIKVGVDLSRENCKEAHDSGVYDAVVVADATKLPFKDGYFRNILANSVMEHIPEYRQVLQEVYRTLDDKGIFVFTVPSDHFDDLLFIPQILKPFRKSRKVQEFMEYYKSERKQSLLHFNVFSPSEWSKALEETDLKTLVSKYYLAPRTMFVWDLLCILSNKMKMSLIIQLIPKCLFSWLFGLLCDTEAKRGGGLIIVAQKSTKRRKEFEETE